MAGKLSQIAQAVRSTPGEKEAGGIEKTVSTVMSQGARLSALFVLALPGAMGALGLYGVYDMVRMHNYQSALIGLGVTAIFFCPVVLTVLAEINQRKFVRWLEENRQALAAGKAVYRGAQVSARSEVVTFDLAFSVVLASFKIPSQMFIVGQHRIWPWRIAYTLLSFVFGWWGIPWGPVYTLQALHNNVMTLNRRRLGEMVDIPEWDGSGGNF